MKKLTLFSVAVLMTAFVFAQTPQMISYQAVIRNSNNALVVSTPITMQISIMRGSTPVYVELQSTATNADGLISVEIGNGSVISGSVSSINWSSGTYYVSTEADINGMGVYTITGTSQLLSVPYALHAKTVGSITETDPIFVASPASHISNANITGWNTAYSWGNHAGLYKPISYTPDGSETKVNAGTNVTVTGTGTTASPYVINAASSTPAHYVGELYQGGVVFYVDNTGNHGLICSMIDLSNTVMWSTLLTTVAGALSDWNGASNTVAIAASTTTTCAADICDTYTNTNYGTGVYSDWYLPSRSEMSLLIDNVYAIQKALENDGNETTVVLNNK